MPSIIFSQPWINNLNEEQKNNFFEIQKSFADYWKDKDHTVKGNGWKQFKRWENYWKDRVNEDGSFPNRMYIYNEFQRSKKIFEKKKAKSDSEFQGANSWTNVGPTEAPGIYWGLGRINCIVTDPYDSDKLYAGAANGGFWKSTNGGNTWSTNTDNLSILPSLGVSDIAINPNNTDIIYIATGDYSGYDSNSSGIMKSTDGGDTWATTGMNYELYNYRFLGRVLVDPEDPNVILVATNAGIFRSTDAAANFTQVQSGNFKDMEFKPGDSDVIYASFQNIYRSTNNGSSWSKLSGGLPTSNIERIAIAVSEDKSDLVMAIVADNTRGLKGIWRSDDSGDSWTQKADNDPNYLDWYNGNEQGGQGEYDLCIGINHTNSNEVIIGGVNLWRSNNGGNNWSRITEWWNQTSLADIHADQHYIYYHPTSSEMFVGNDGGVYKTTDGGNSFSWESNGMGITQYYSLGVAQTKSNLVIGGAQDNGVSRYKEGTWAFVAGGDGMICAIDPTDDKIMYSELYYGDLQKSTNGGASFEDVFVGNEEGAWVTPYTLDYNNPETIYIGMDNMWKSTNGGDNFTKQDIFLASGKFRNVVVSRDNSNIVYATTNTQVFSTTNGGSDWELQSRPGSNNITDIIVDPNSSTNLWATNSGFTATNKVFFSADGGGNWVNITKNLPNVPVYSLVYDNVNSKIYCGNEFGVYYTNADNSSDWTEFSDGLPNVTINEMKIQETAQKLYVATYGRGIWEIDLAEPVDSPTLVLPSNGVKFFDLTQINFDWDDVANADAYDFQLSDESNFSNLIVDENDVALSEYLYTGTLAYNKNHYWRARTIKNSLKSDWSPVFTFKTKIQVPQLTSPANASVDRDVDVSLKWLVSDGADSYLLELSNNDSFTDLNVSKEVTGLEYQLSELDFNSPYWWRVKAKNSDGETDWSSTFTFGTTIADPILQSPEFSKRMLDTNGVLKWKEVEGASTYDIQASIKDDFSDNILDVTGHSSNTILYSGFEKATTYYWKVKASNANSTSNWSDFWMFSTLLDYPTLVSPDSNSFFIKPPLTLEWTDYDYALSYKFQYSKSIDFSEVITEFNISNNFIEITELDFATTYFWRVKIQTEQDTSEWSDIWTFTSSLDVPILTSPSDSSKNIALSGKLEWEAVDSATEYKVQLSKMIDFSSDIIVDEIVNTNSYDYSGIKNNNNYYWRVMAKNDNNEGVWSATWKFTTPVEIPVLTSPGNNAKNVNQYVKLEWEEFTEADVYHLNLSKNSDFSNNLIDKNDISANYFQADTLDELTEYFWKVRAINDESTSDWSETWAFTTAGKEVILPTIPSLISPLNNAQDLPFDLVNLKWNEADNTDKYHLQMSTFEDFNDDIVIEDNTLVAFEYSFEELDPETIYFWRVKGINNEGESNWSEVWNFKTKPDKGIEEYLNSEILISPNPVENIANIFINLKHSLSIELSIVDLNHKNIYQTNKTLSSGNNEFDINLDKFSKGSYFMIIKINDSYQSFKFIKK